LTSTKFPQEPNFIEEINVNEAIKKAIHTIEDTEDLDNQVFHVRYKDLPTVNFNRYYLVVLFGELISNAIKFRKLNHFVQIEINAKETAHNWIFEVKDSGEGFEMKNVAQVFELFKKLHNRLLYKGVGMGLPIAKKIVESYNGNIRINTEINQGTTVRFTIPKM
jgi:light-regulated signal transduction histidine kinase (bacteriophytochrome)